MITPFGNKKQLQETVHNSEAVGNRKKTFMLGSSMVKTIFLSAIICRSQILKEMVKCINFLLKLIIEENTFSWKYQNQILMERWCQVSSFFLILLAYFFLFVVTFWRLKHINIEPTYSKLTNTRNCELISTKIITNMYYLSMKITC